MAHRLSGAGRRGQLSRASESLNCQRSYLSRVITEELHITPDHAFNLAKFWKLTSDEREYFQTLVEMDRAADSQYRAHLKARLLDAKRKHESIQERTNRSSLSIDAVQASYFSSWLWSAIHFLTSIPEYQSVEAIGDRLGLKHDSVLFYLRQLETLGFIENVNGRWKYKSGEFHAPKNSPLVLLHHQNWRGRAVVDAQEFETDNIHFTGVHTLSRVDFERLKELMLSFIAEATQVAGPSEPEEAIAITCDLFRI